MVRFSFRPLLFSLGFLFALGVASSAQAQGFGAISIGEGGAWGYAAGFEDVSSAQDRAIAECTKHGKGCRVLRVFHNTCAALSVRGEKDDFIFYWVSGRDREQLRGAATRNCEKDGGRCQILTDFCSGR
jgi:hypothetical protein